MPYIIPSENGGKADVRWMALRRGEGGAGLLMQAETGTVFEVSRTIADPLSTTPFFCFIVAFWFALPHWTMLKGLTSLIRKRRLRAADNARPILAKRHKKNITVRAHARICPHRPQASACTAPRSSTKPGAPSTCRRGPRAMTLYSCISITAPWGWGAITLGTRTLSTRSTPYQRTGRTGFESGWRH